MKIYKQTLNERSQIVVQDGKNKFIIGFFGSDVYWIMLDYIPDNKFTIKKNCTYLFNFIESLFSTEHFKNCTFTWLSEARLPENSSSLKITKGQDFYRIKFIQHEGDFLAKAQNICPICFCLNGSRNQQVANKFSILLNELLTRDFN